MSHMRIKILFLFWLVFSILLINYGLVLCLTEFVAQNKFYSTVLGCILITFGSFSYYRLYNDLSKEEAF
jgi:hypothetical protein